MNSELLHLTDTTLDGDFALFKARLTKLVL
jgi:hypothetical protein